MENLQIIPASACKQVEAQYVEMKVPLYSYGCEKKMKKALSHLRVTVDYKLQKVTVWGICDKYDVLATIKSKRKGARFWNSDEAEEQRPQPGFMSMTPSSRLWIWKSFKNIIKSYN
ncbi:hypothetical protein ACLOJK_007016 [Asimina triloba]